jgi:hypothetical protein
MIYEFAMDRFQIGTSNLRLQFATSSYGGRRYLPYVFTEQGVAMLATVLNSDRAIAVNIAIMRTFVRFRQILATHKQLAARSPLWRKNTTTGLRWCSIS